MRFYERPASELFRVGTVGWLTMLKMGICMCFQLSLDVPRIRGPQHVRGEGDKHVL